MLIKKIIYKSLKFQQQIDENVSSIKQKSIKHNGKVVQTEAELIPISHYTYTWPLTFLDRDRHKIKIERWGIYQLYGFKIQTIVNYQQRSIEFHMKYIAYPQKLLYRYKHFFFFSSSCFHFKLKIKQRSSHQFRNKRN